ncbi:UNVERIFIED_CONTAM: Neurobeachin, partial [Eudyptes robustus]
ITDHLIQSARRRDFAIAAKSLERTRNVLVSPSGPWAEGDAAKKQTFWRLDPWEDDSRRRKRFVPNIFGSTHPEAVLDKESDAVQDAEAQLEKLSEDEREQMLKDLAKRMITTGRTNQLAAELVDESDIDKWATEELETREQRGERASFSTPAQLIASVVAVPGTVSITQSDVYFDADEEDPTFKKLDPKTLKYCDYLHGRWHFQEIRAIFLRRYKLRYVALELFLSSRTAVMFAFPSQDLVKAVVDHLPRVGVGVKYGLPQSRKTSL